MGCLVLLFLLVVYFVSLVVKLAFGRSGAFLLLLHVPVGEVLVSLSLSRCGGSYRFSPSRKHAFPVTVILLVMRNTRVVHQMVGCFVNV